MILSPHVLTAPDGQYLAIIRHPPDEKPRATRKTHTVVALIRKLPHGWRVTEDAFHQGQVEAKQWIAAHQGDIAALPAAPGYGLVDQLRRRKQQFASSRDRDARVLRLLRQGLPLDDILEREPTLDRTVLRRLISHWPRLSRYKAPMNDLWPHRRMKAGPSALPTGIVDAVAIARRLASATGPLDWPALSEVVSPPLGRMTVHRHVRLLQETFGVQMTRVRGQGWIVRDWGLFDLKRLQRLTTLDAESA